MSNEITAENKNKVRDLIKSDGLRGGIQAALPKHIKADRMMATVEQAFRLNQKLFGCTPQSLKNCILKSAQFGVFPDLIRADWNIIGDTKEIDILGAHLLGFDAMKIPLLRHAGDEMRWRIMSVAVAEAAADIANRTAAQKPFPPARAPKGWADHVELGSTGKE